MAGRKLIFLALKCLVSDSDRAALRADRYCVGDDRERRVASNMKRIRWWALHALWLGVVALVPVGVASEAVALEDPRWQLSSSLTYESGTFGTSNRTETLYVPFTLKRLFSQGDIGLTVPFVVLQTTGETTLVDGQPQRIRRARQSNLAPAGTVTKAGLGDMLLKGRYYAVDEHDFFPTIALVAKVKFPTADSSEGLGTGKFDEGIGVEVSRRFLERFIAFLDLSYTVIGSPSGIHLDNQTAYDIGLGYQVTPQLLASVFYEERTALLSDQPNPRSFLLTADYKISQAFRVNSAIEVGLSNGAPDYGLTAGASWRF